MEEGLYPSLRLRLTPHSRTIRSQVILFILSFAVFGASGKEVAFPNW
jgi:hypothetical protein